MSGLTVVSSMLNGVAHEKLSNFYRKTRLICRLALILNWEDPGHGQEIILRRNDIPEY